MAIKYKKFIFILPAKTGSTSLTQYLLELGGEEIPKEDVIIDGEYGIHRQHANIPELLSLNLISMDEIRSLQVVSVMRNPFDHAVSEYLFRQRQFELNVHISQFPRPKRFTIERIKASAELDFNEYIKRFQRPLSVIERCLMQAENPVIMRFETLESDLCRVLGHPVNIPHLNKNPLREKHYREYYTDESRKIVGEMFAEDFKKYHYEF